MMLAAERLGKVSPVHALRPVRRIPIQGMSLSPVVGRTLRATNAGGASTALVGTPETVAAAILDYVDLGADLAGRRQGPVDERELPRREDEVARHDGRHVRRDGSRHRRQREPQLGEAVADRAHAPPPATGRFR